MLKTRLDDPDIVRLIRSIPFRKRSRFVTCAIGELKFYFALFAFLFPYLAISMFFALLGPVVWIVASVVLGPVFFCPLIIYRNKLLKRHLEESIVDGKLPNCPSCGTSQLNNNAIHCECGCVIRPFAPHD
ncbi:hypothetical protein [Aeoliella mucimassa]|uniref:Uncharacterized protein n=1 Tax=Aeoliella mucimassa TaxID=2527972 RepID=A0A518AVJ0_9BACT|nr:hypothetical protein [Aeoliella mucimassa]QDU58731.1 hypothetical protein Pan181_49710 [Aeoliella mucimassa]